MKKLLALLLLVSATALGAQTNQHYTVTWIPSPTAYTGPTNVALEIGSYYFYFSTNVSQPLTNWVSFGSCVMSVPVGTNYVAVSSFGNFIAMQPPVFAYMTASNSAGVSPFSNLAAWLGPMSNGRLTGVTTP